MKLKNLTFEQWLKNHSTDHEDKWCRELYPFHVFSRIQFDQNQLNKEQSIGFYTITFYVTLTKIELQENGRCRTTFDIATFPRTKTQEWKQRKWNTTFQIVYTTEYEFITIFAKKEDPSKDYVVRFMKGNFQKINENKSSPVSELLIRTLILHIAEEDYPGGKHNENYDFTTVGVRELPEHPQFHRKKVNHFAPIYTIGRDLWVCYSFTEEKAHRVAFYNANQCKNLIVVFCNPTYTRHHRCKYPETKVISIYELANSVSHLIRKKFEGQIRFLQNHLNLLDKIDTEKILIEIENPSQHEYEIKKTDMMEALGIMKIHPNTTEDFFHSLSALNLINAYLSRQRANRQTNEKESKLFRNMYYFKSYLADIITDRIKNKDLSTPIYKTGNLIMVEMFNFQFSFHNIPLNDTLIEFAASINNKEIVWTGRRLQPIAPLLLKYSREKRQET